MTSSSPYPESDYLQQRLLAVNCRRRRWARVTVAVKIAWWWCAAMLGLVLLDAVWPMPSGLRLCLCLAVVALGGLVVVGTWPMKQNPKTESLREAERIERHYRLKRNRLTNAVWLASVADRPGHDLTSVLARRSMALARHDVDSVDLDTVIHAGSFRGALLRLMCVIAVGLVVWLLWPQQIGEGLARLVQPWSDHPHANLTRFDVSVLPKRPAFGENARVTVKLSGRIPDQAELVELDPLDRVSRRWPMERIGADQFQRRLLALRQPVSFRIETRRGRSHRFRIEPVEPAEPAHRSSFDKTLKDPGRQTDQPVSSLDTAQVARRTAVALRGLADGAERIQRDATDLVNQTDGHSARLLEPNARRFAQLNQRLSRFRADGQALRQKLRAHDSRDRKGLGRGFGDVADRLGQLTLSRMDPVPIHDARGGTTGQRGQLTIRGRARSESLLRAWLERVEHAADRDRRLLRQVQSHLDEAMGSGVGDLDQPETRRETSLASGAYDEVLQSQARVTDQPDAVMQRVPESYRQAVAWYFQRLAQEQSR